MYEDQFIRLSQKAAEVRRAQYEGYELVAAEEIEPGDVFDFAGATLRAVKVEKYEGASLIEICAVGPFAGTTVHYLPFEEVRVFLPRAKALA